ncbi:MAG: SGNH/GDSL hydrolase family protein [Candidatus Bathyarchaeia archaeon]
MKEFLLKSGDKIVLIGDSITDCGRRTDFPPLGNGYVYIASNLTTAKYPEREILWVNKGVSGDTVQDLDKRWTEDVINENPDWVSIYIGINNAIREPSLEDFEKCYRKIVNRTLNETNARIVMFEIFYVPSEDPLNRGLNITPYNKIICDIAHESKAMLVPISKAFDEAVKRGKTRQWTTNDGFHPNQIGHTLIALKFLEKLGW